MPIMPAWSIDECVREAKRCAAMGYRGVNMTSDPQDSGSPDLGSPEWDPFWDVCEELQLPVHFHIGASQTSLNYFGTTYWPSQDEYVKPAIGGASLFQNNSRLLLNSAYSGMFDRHPDLKMVSVESGIGWIPFMLEAMDYELEENAPEYAKKLKKLPSEYFRDHWYATLWFEHGRGDLQHLIDSVGEDNIMFETDWPHPTCLLPESPRGGRGEDRRAPARDPAQGDGRHRHRAVPTRRLSAAMPRTEVDGVSIAYEIIGEIVGDGRPWVLTPGGRFSKDYPGVRELAVALAEHGNRVLDLGPSELRRVRGVLPRRLGVGDAGRHPRRAAPRSSTWRRRWSSEDRAAPASRCWPPTDTVTSPAHSASGGSAVASSACCRWPATTARRRCRRCGTTAWKR